MKTHKLIDYIFYHNGFTTRQSWVSNGFKLLSFSGQNLIFSDKNGNKWLASVNTTNPIAQ